MAHAAAVAKVRLSRQEHPHLARKLIEELKAAYDMRMRALAVGAAVDYAEYREKVGYLQGLSEAMAVAHLINKELTGD